MQPFSDGRRVLLVEDDIIAREIAAAHLRWAGFDVTEASTVATALAATACRPFDLAVLDVNLPDGLGFDLASRLQHTRAMPIVYITSNGAIEDRLRGLETGGDDYLVKPFDHRELLARIRLVLRRHQPVGQERARVVAFGGWIMDLVRRELTDANGSLVRLTRAEFDLFAALYHSGTTILDRDYLLEVVGSADTRTKLRTIDVMISRIRRKLADGSRAGPCIVTKRGEGYLLLPNGR